LTPPGGATTLNLKMHFKFNRAALLLAVAAGCMAGAAVPVAGPNDLARGASRYPDLTADELAAGRSLFLGRCGSCHLPPAPSSQSPDAWPAHIAEMKVRAHLDEKQFRAVERDLVTMSIASRTVAAAPAAR
jgi:mono/diheme cytochrome c family protein